MNRTACDRDASLFLAELAPSDVQQCERWFRAVMRLPGLVRPTADISDATERTVRTGLLRGEVVRFGDVTDPSSLARDGFRRETFDVLVSCLASRTGSPDDAWAIDFNAHVDALKVSKAAGVTQFLLLSAICVQKPVLAFQHAKLAFGVS